MSDYLERDLGWFWYSWLWQTASVDGSIQSVRLDGDEVVVAVRQDGDMPSPVVLDVTFTAARDAASVPGAATVGERTLRVTRPVEVWFDGTEEWVALTEIDGVVSTPSRRRARGSSRKILPAFLLAWFVGPLGVHRFYAGRTGSGVAMLLISLTLVGLLVTALWALIDLIVLATGNFRDGDGELMKEWS